MYNFLAKAVRFLYEFVGFKYKFYVFYEAIKEKKNCQ